MAAELSRAGLRVGLLAILTTAVPGSAHDPGQSRFKYGEHVRPILEKHCGSCHHSGGIAPMSLLTFQEAVPWARSMKARILDGRMPPWLPEEGVGAFRGARSLSAQEIDVLVEWAAGGTPAGEAGRDRPARPPAAGSVSSPDLLLEPPRDSILGPDESEKTECIVFTTRLGRDRSLVAVELRPGNESIVRGAALFLGSGCSEEERPVAGWLPGDGPFRLPDGAAEPFRSGTPVSARIFYRKTWLQDGKTVRDRSRVGLYFGEGKLEALRHLRLREGQRAEFPRRVRLVSVFPRGTSERPLRIEAALPNQGRRTVFAIERFDPEWRTKYVFSSPLEVSEGASLIATGGSFWVDYLPARGRY